MLFIKSGSVEGERFAVASLFKSIAHVNKHNVKNFLGNNFLLLSGAVSLAACGGGGGNSGGAAGSGIASSPLAIMARQASPSMDALVGSRENGFTASVPSTESSELIVDLSRTNPVGQGGYFHDDIFIGIRNLIGGNGVNKFTGGDEANEFVGGSSEDIFIGNGGNDILRGGGDTDRLNGGPGNDRLEGGGGNDILNGGVGADALIGGSGNNDIATYFDSSSAITASLASPSLNTGEAAGDTYSGIENLQGSDHNDTLIGDDRNNVLVGEAGRNFLIGGGGSDFVSYVSSSRGIIVSLADPSMNTGDADNDTYNSIENIQGGSHDDTLIGNSEDNIIIGGPGDDTIRGGAGDDRLAPYEGDDNLYGGLGNDIFFINIGDQTIFDFSVPTASNSASVRDMLDFTQLSHLASIDILPIRKPLSQNPTSPNDYVLEYRFDGDGNGSKDSSVTIMTVTGSIGQITAESHDILSLATMFADA